MPTINTIVKEIKDIPVNRLEELYEFIHILTPKKKQNETLRKKILSFGDAFSDMSAKEYKAFLNHAKKTRNQLFDRIIEL